MTRALPAPPLLVITDRLAADEDLMDIVTDVLQAGCRWIMVREKDLDSSQLAALSSKIVARARPFNACVLVNGAAAAARQAGAAGVHLQRADDIAAARTVLGEGALVGVSTHSIDDVQAAAAAGADYVTLSPIFLTDSKPGYGPAIGISALSQICTQVDLPIVALAGVTADNAASCLVAGSAAVAVMGTVMRSERPERTVRALLQSITD